jgi:hypothetical protein
MKSVEQSSGGGQGKSRVSILIVTTERTDSFRIADPSGVGPLITTSAFIGTNSTGELITSGLPVIQTQSPSVHASVISEAVLFGEVDATQQALEASVGTKWVESRIHFQVAEER